MDRIGRDRRLSSWQCENGNAYHRHCCPADLNHSMTIDAACLGDRDTQANADPMKQRRTADKSQPIKQSRRAFRHFCPVSVTVENCTKSNKEHRYQRRYIELKCNSQPQYNSRYANADFHERQFDTSHAGNASEGHDRNEGQRHEPRPPATQVSGEHTDRNHRQNMVDAAERMGEAVHETVSIANSGMGPRRNGRKCYDDGAKSQNRADHCLAAGLVKSAQWDHLATPKRDFRLPRPVFSNAETICLTTMSG